MSESGKTYDVVFDDDLKVVCAGLPEVVKDFLRLLPKKETDEYRVCPEMFVRMKSVESYLKS